METFKSPAFGLTSNPGETEQDFRNRLLGAATNKQNETIDKLKKQYEAKKQTLESRLTKVEQARDREGEQARSRKMQTVISFGATVLGSLFGRKKLSTGTLGRATTTMRDIGRTMDQSGDVKRADRTSKTPSRSWPTWRPSCRPISMRSPPRPTRRPKHSRRSLCGLARATSRWTLRSRVDASLEGFRGTMTPTWG